MKYHHSIGCLLAAVSGHELMCQQRTVGKYWELGYENIIINNNCMLFDQQVSGLDKHSAGLRPVLLSFINPYKWHFVQHHTNTWTNYGDVWREIDIIIHTYVYTLWWLIYFEQHTRGNSLVTVPWSFLRSALHRLMMT